ncbi:MAG TPA: hypothetical protein VMU29_07140 [Smithella sp.]|nr:hypothetical protein [Smithella sp.]
MNKEWHSKNKMQPKATLNERIDWHLRHQKNCACREMPKSLAKYVNASREKPFKEPHYFIDSGYIAIGKNYATHQQQAQSHNLQESSVDMQELQAAHTLLLGVIGAILEEHDGKKIPASEEAISRKFVITAVLIQGILLCEQTILCGLYVQAGALIRQEFDALAALSEIRQGKRKDGITPNAKNAPWKGKRHYGELSSLTHLSDHKILDTLIGYNTSWGDFASTVPQYQKINGTRLYATHIAYVLALVEELLGFYGEIYDYASDQREKDVIDNAYSILIKYGIFKEPGTTPITSL